MGKIWKAINLGEDCPECGYMLLEVFTMDKALNKVQIGDPLRCCQCHHLGIVVMAEDVLKVNWNQKQLPEGTVEVWEVTPHIDSRYDSWIIAVKDDPDGRKALEYAKDSLENQWDISEKMDIFNISVNIKKNLAEETDLIDPFE